MTSAEPPTIRGGVHQGPHLAAGAREVQALITVDAVGAGPERVVPEAAEVIVVDESSSMRDPSDKIRSAVAATAAAIDELRDGVLFAVLGGSHRARPLYPVPAGLARADPVTRAAATAALAGIEPSGGTAIGTWLALAGSLLEQHPAAIRHVTLLTDGRNQHESAAELDAAVAAWAGVFRCDCRGIGSDFSAIELRRIARGLLGSVGRVAAPERLAADFRALIAASMAKEAAGIGQLVWTAPGVTIRLVKQAAPDPVDLTARRTAVGDHVGLYPTGAWGSEQRDFHLAAELAPGLPGQERLACRASFVQVLAGGGHRALRQSYVHSRPGGGRESHPHALVTARWSADPAVPTEPHPRVLASHDQQAVEDTVDLAVAAFEKGDDPRAAEWLTSARTIADRAGMTDLVELIDGMRDPDDGSYAITAGGLLDVGVGSGRQPVWRPRS